MNRIARWFCTFLVIGRLALPHLAAAEANFIWIEAETPTSADFTVTHAVPPENFLAMIRVTHTCG